MKIVFKAILGGFGIWLLMLALILGLSFLASEILEIPELFAKIGITDSRFWDAVIFTTLFLGLVFTGFMTARVARKYELLHGFVIGIIICIIIVSIVLISFKIWDKSSEPPNLLRLVLVTLGISFSTLFGSFIQKKAREKKEIKESIEHKIDKLGERTD